MLKVTLKKSIIGHVKTQKATAKSLGLGKIGSSAVHSESPSVMGMIRKIQHLVEVETLADPVEVKE